MNDRRNPENEVEGYDSSESSGWDEYPLDSVFVRTEQRTVGEVVKRIDADRYELDPDFQRDFVWPLEKQSRLIESCLMRIPLPVFYVAEAKDGRIIVVDGLQRLTTFKRYVHDEFGLTGLGANDEEATRKNLLGKRFSDLPVNLRERIEDTQLTLYILDAKAPERAKLDIFERVNSGVPLSRQQMRNCLYNGPATHWLRETADSKIFLKVTGESLDRKSMRDREAVNRFCAFRLLGSERYRGDMDSFLATTLERMNRLSTYDLQLLASTFQNSMRVNAALFREHAFRKSLQYSEKNVGRSVLNISLFDVCSVLLADVSPEALAEKAESLREKIRSLLTRDSFIHAITYSTNSTKQVRTRFLMARTALEEIV